MKVILSTSLQGGDTRFKSINLPVVEKDMVLSSLLDDHDNWKVGLIRYHADLQLLEARMDLFDFDGMFPVSQESLDQWTSSLYKNWFDSREKAAKNHLKPLDTEISQKTRLGNARIDTRVKKALLRLARDRNIENPVFGDFSNVTLDELNSIPECGTTTQNKIFELLRAINGSQHIFAIKEGNK